MSPAQPTPTLATDTHPNQHCRPQAEHCLVVIHDTHINNIANITLDEWRPGRPGYLRETACAELLRIQTTIVERHPAPVSPRPGQDPYLLPATLSRRRSGHKQQGRGCLLLCSSAHLLLVVICKIRPFSSILSIFCSFSTKLGFFRGRNFHLQNVTLRLEDICCPVVTIVRRGGHSGQHRCSLVLEKVPSEGS